MMATATTTPSKLKSAFIKEFLFDNPKANPPAVNAAWTAAGMEGKISDSLVNKLRSELGLSGNLRARRTPVSGKSAANAATTMKATTTKVARVAQNKVSGAGRAIVKKPGGALDQVIAEIERDIDRLIFKLMALGGLPDVEDGLRQVRRQLVLRSHTG